LGFSVGSGVTKLGNNSLGDIGVINANGLSWLNMGVSGFKRSQMVSTVTTVHADTNTLMIK